MDRFEFVMVEVTEVYEYNAFDEYNMEVGNVYYAIKDSHDDTQPYGIIIDEDVYSFEYFRGLIALSNKASSLASGLCEAGIIDWVWSSDVELVEIKREV